MHGDEARLQSIAMALGGCSRVRAVGEGAGMNACSVGDRCALSSAMVNLGGEVP